MDAARHEHRTALNFTFLVGKRLTRISSPEMEGVVLRAQATTTDLDTVRAALIDLQAAGRHQDVIDVVLALVGKLREDNVQLQVRLAQLLRQSFGRKSEKIDPNQLQMILAAASSASEAAVLQAPAMITPPRAAERARRPTGRKALPAWLPREERVHVPDAVHLVCSDCGGAKTRIGAEKSYMLELVPASFKVIVDVREKHACAACQVGVVIAPVPDKPIEGGLPGPGLVAHTLIAKYKDGLPLNRLAGIYKRSGVEIAPSTLGDWVRGGAALLEPLSKRIFDRVMAAHVVQADDTGLRVLDASHADGIKRGHLWGFVGDRRLVAFAYTETWEGALARAHLTTRRGWLQVDGYAGLAPLFAGADPPCVAVGCMAHCRRKVVVALEAGDLRAALGVKLLQGIYAVESDADDQKLDHLARLALRLQQSAPLMDELGQWIARMHPATPPKSPLGKALTYATNQWRELRRFLEDGRLEIDNNGVERALRPIAVGRKGWLFAGSDEGARRAAVLYTVIGSAVLCDVEPWAYLRAVVEEMSGAVSVERLDELVPDVWARTHSTAPPTEPAL